MVDFLGQPVENLPGYKPPQLQLTPPPPPPPPQPVVVDRVAYLQQQRQMNLLLEEARQQEAIARATAPLIRAAAPVLRWLQLGEQFEREDELRRARQERLGRSRGSQTIDEQGRVRRTNFGFDEAPRAFDLVDAARTEIPGAERVAEVAGQVGRMTGEGALRLAQGPFGAQIPGTGLGVEDIPVVGRVQQAALDVAGGAGEFAFEAVIPTEVWMAALELVPGVGYGPDALRGARRLVAAAREAGVDISPAGLRAFAKSDAGQNVIRIIKGEAGGGVSGGGMGQGPEDLIRASRGEAADEQAIAGQMENRLQGLRDQPSTATTIESLEAQRANINRALRALRAPEAKRAVAGEVDDVFKIAARYEPGSEQRAALKLAAGPKIQDLPPAQQKFILASIDALPSQSARKLATDAQRARQFSRGAEAFDEAAGTIEERVATSFKAFGGKQEQRFTPVGDRFSDEETAELMEEIVKAAEDGRIGKVFDRNNAVSALNLLLTGERLPGVASEAAKALNLSPGEIKLLGQVFGPKFAAAIPKSARHMSGLATFIDVLNLPRAIITALDVSAAGRQGILLAARNPIEWGRSFAPMIRAMASEEGFQRAAANIRRNSKYEDALRHGLDITDIGGGFQGEEAFISRIASKLPFIRGSERGYVMFLDNLRMLSYEKYANRAEKLAQKQGWSVERLDIVKQNVAKFLNVASGRGDLKVAGEFIPALNAIFFSPRFVVSRPQSVWAMVRPGADKFTRQIAFENLGAFVGMGTGMLLTAKMMGADVEVDPRSSDFGKMRFGNTRIDFWGGFQPLARYMAQIGSAQRKDLATGEISDFYPGTAALRFFRSKLAPSGSLIFDYAAGKNYQGDDVFFRHPTQMGVDKETAAAAWKEFRERILPLSLQDAWEGYQTGGVAGAVTGAGVSAVGGGITTFEPSEGQTKKVERSAAVESLSSAGIPFADDKIDFRQPQLDGKPKGDKTQRQIIADTLKIDVDDDASMSEMQAAYVEQKLQAYMESAKVGEVQARYALEQAFKNFAPVKTINANADAAIMNYWRAHPDKLREALDAGLTPPSKEKLEILSGQENRD